MRTVHVGIKEHPYDVVIGNGARHGLRSLIKGLSPEVRKVAIVTQKSLCKHPWFCDIDPGIESFLHVIPEGEAAKSLGTIELLCADLADHGVSRNDLIIGVGGGVVSDVAGFASAVHLRGIRYVNVATTMLAQIDAAIGGKTGVNVSLGKNLVGAFWQPLGVLCDTEVLATLDPREWACGRGELAKYILLSSPKIDISLARASIIEQVEFAVSMKAEIVAADERESMGNERSPLEKSRMILNYGHTLAHGLESYGLRARNGKRFKKSEATDRLLDLRHGEAVAIGLMYAAHLAHYLGRIDAERVEVHRQVLAMLDLSSLLPGGVDPAHLVSVMGMDKKATGDLTFVLDGNTGIEVVRGVDPFVALSTLEQMAEQDRSEEQSP